MRPTEPAVVDWERVKRCLAALHRQSRPFLSRALLIGGAACWFYRNALRHASDPDFKVPTLSPELESKWLSKDLDFTGIFSGDAIELMPQFVVRGASRPAHVVVEGVRLGFAQVGLTIDPEEARLTCRVGRFGAPGGETVEFYIADPVTMYREKQALVLRRNAPADSLHLALLSEYLRYEVCQQAERLCVATSLAETKAALNYLGLVRDRAPEIFADPRVAHRIEDALQSKAGAVNPPDERFLRSLVASA